MNAKMEGYATFFIKGRGMVLAGWITEGTAEPGMLVSIPSIPRKLEIIGIEQLNAPAGPSGTVGLLFPYGSDEEIALWKDLKVEGQIVNIERSAESRP